MRQAIGDTQHIKQNHDHWLCGHWQAPHPPTTVMADMSAATESGARRAMIPGRLSCRRTSRSHRSSTYLCVYTHSSMEKCAVSPQDTS
jgi:hypothetical protein